MDKIELRVVDHDGIAVHHHWYAIFGMAGGTIGRSSQNKLIISDPNATVARVHAMVRLDTDGAYVANLNERAPIWLDNQEVGCGQEVRLQLGNRLRIGNFTLSAVLPGTPFKPQSSTTTDKSEQHTQPVHINFDAAPASHQTPSSPIHSQLTPERVVVNDDWGNLGTLGLDSPLMPKPMVTGASDSTIFPIPQHSQLIPSDFNPFAARPAPQDDWNTSLPTLGVKEFSTQRYDGMVNALPLTGRIHEKLDDASHTGLPACFDPSPSLDPMVLFKKEHLLGEKAALSHTTHRDNELGQAFNLPRIQGLAAASVEKTPLPKSTTLQEHALPTASVIASAQTGLSGLLPTDGLDIDIFDLSNDYATANTAQTANLQNTTPKAVETAPPPAHYPSNNSFVSRDALIRTVSGVDNVKDTLAQAFIEGAGLDPAKADFEITPDFMRTFGEALRIAVQGTIDLLSARSEIKREFRAGVTVIATGANNPLKFLPSAEGVMMQMVGQTFPGFMKPLPAMQDAYQDLHVHQLALMAGIRAAYTEALVRFDPGELERRTETSPRLLDKLLLNSRKAALWDDYKHNFDVLRRHAEDDLMAFSGKTFVDAYEQAEQSTRETKP